MSTPIVKTKLFVPPTRPELVPRPRLIEQLNAGLSRKLTLLSAPAGCGKTTLLSEWVTHLRSRMFDFQSRPVDDSVTLGTGSVENRKSNIRYRIAWLSLDESDNDLARFLSYLIAVVATVEAAIEQRIPTAPQAMQLMQAESSLAALINKIAPMQDHIVLVLDDYHLIKLQAIHDAMTFLLDHLPPQMHLVLATRADPPLPLPRLRARGHLTELRQSDLRFTTDEAAAFLNDVMGLGLSVKDVAALEARTEGWIAGLQMAALSLQRHSPHAIARSDFVRAFTGSHRFVLDYLVEEVLEQQPPALQEFLLKTSILERLSGPLCDAVLDIGDRGLEATDDQYLIPNIQSPSQQILEHLEAANLFIVPLDDERHCYRYHRLFRDLLRKRLWQTSPALVPALHRRASAWHEQQGLTAEAIGHALAAQDQERAAVLIEDNVEATMMRSEVTTFLNWVEKLPDELVRTHPTLAFFHTWALAMSGWSLEVVEQRLRDIARAQDVPESTGTMAGRIAALRAYLMLFQADMHRAAELCRQAMAHLPESDLFLRSIVAWILSQARLAGGDLQDGSQALKEVARMSQEIGNPLIAVAALCHEAKLQVRQGRLHQAREILERALEWATDLQGRRLPIASKALTGLGELEREWNDLEVAADYLAEGIELAKQWSELSAFDAYFPLARVRLAQGDVDAAREALETARHMALKSRITEVDDLVADLQQASFLASQGEVEEAMRWAEKRGLVPDFSQKQRPDPGQGRDYVNAHLRKYEQLVLARLFILQRQSAEALCLLEPLLAHARQVGRIDLIIQIQILRTLAYQVEVQDAQAMAALSEVLSLAEPGGYLRIFLDEGEAMAGLLRQAASRGIAPAYVAKLLGAFGRPESVQMEAEPSHPRAQPLIDPLSERELEVLRLLATGLSNPEIADELVVAVSTVRSHCKSIYGKLNVHKRWDAVQRAQQLGIIA
jgi:LuxR family maltose regulon positive regulatory protein